MKCPVCGFIDSKVIDTRASEDNERIKRKRECLKCQHRFLTYEVLEIVPIVVIKKDDTREKFDRNKLLNGILKACEKRPITLKSVEDIVSIIEKKIRNLGEKEVASSLIGECVMADLKNLDKVAYIRFASVYRQFEDVESFVLELETLKKINSMH